MAANQRPLAGRHFKGPVSRGTQCLEEEEKQPREDFAVRPPLSERNRRVQKGKEGKNWPEDGFVLAVEEREEGRLLTGGSSPYRGGRKRERLTERRNAKDKYTIAQKVK